MKINENKFQEYRAFLRRLVGKYVRRPPVGEDITPETSSARRLNPLERITEHLRRLGLGQQVRVRFEAAGGDYILEDADGYVHAKDYAEAVILIERIWLYQP